MGQDNKEKFLVLITEVVTQSVVIEVDATDKEQAREIAMDNYNYNDKLFWQRGKSEIVEFDIQRLPK